MKVLSVCGYTFIYNTFMCVPMVIEDYTFTPEDYTFTLVKDSACSPQKREGPDKPK